MIYERRVTFNIYRLSESSKLIRNVSAQFLKTFHFIANRVHENNGKSLILTGSASIITFQKFSLYFDLAVDTNKMMLTSKTTKNEFLLR